MVLNSDVSEKEGGDWHGDSTEIALVDYALTKTKLERKPRIAISFCQENA
jgi:Ca2+-transporting ATPase